MSTYFEDQTCLDKNQFESNGIDEWIMLKQSDHTQVKELNDSKNMDPLHICNEIEISSIVEDTPYVCENEIKDMRLEVSRLHECVHKARSKCLTSERKLKKIKRILVKDQNVELTKNKRRDKSLSNNEMIKNLKVAFTLGKKGYKAIKCIYPLPSYSILWNKINNIVIEFGLSSDLIPVLQAKFAVMEKGNTDCILFLAEMPIRIQPWYNHKRKKHYGNATLGDTNQPGTRLMFILLKGLNSNWSQIVSVDVTTDSPKGYDIIKRINEVIDVTRTTELNVRGIVSDIGTNTEAMWTSLGVQVSNRCQKTFLENKNSKVHVFADFQLLLPSLTEALLNESFTLNETIVDSENLPTNIIKGSDVRKLWLVYPGFLSHLQSSDVMPEQFEKTNVDAAIRFFSIETANGLEDAVTTNVLENNKALTTAWFIRLVHKWISIVTSSNVTFSATKENVEETVKFLEYFKSIIQSLEIGVKGWERLNTGLILSTTSFINLAQEVFKEDHSSFLLGSGLSQNTLEIMLCEFKRRLANETNAMKCLRVMKSMILSQLMLD